MTRLRSFATVALFLALGTFGSMATTQQGWDATVFTKAGMTLTISKGGLALTSMDIPAGNWVSLYGDRIVQGARGRSEAHGNLEIKVRAPFTSPAVTDMGVVMATASIVLNLKDVDVVLEARAQPSQR